MAEVLNLDEGQSPLLSLLQQTVFEDNCFKKFNAVDILISALDKKIIKLTDAINFQKWLHTEVMSNEKFIRKLQLYNRISDNTETSIEYFSQDYITHPEFHFDSEFIKEMNQINKKVNKFIGLLIQILSEGEKIEL